MIIEVFSNCPDYDFEEVSTRCYKHTNTKDRHFVFRGFCQTWSFLLYFCSMCCTRGGPGLHQRSLVLFEEVEFLLLCSSRQTRHKEFMQNTPQQEVQRGQELCPLPCIPASRAGGEARMGGGGPTWRLWGGSFVCVDGFYRVCVCVCVCVRSEGGPGRGEGRGRKGLGLGLEWGQRREGMLSSPQPAMFSGP